LILIIVGGEYAFLLEAFGRFPALAFVWTSITFLKTGAIAILSAVCGRYAARLVFLRTDTVAKPVAAHEQGTLETGLSLLFLAIGIAVNALSNRLSSRVQNILLIFKLVAVFTIGFFGVYFYATHQGEGPMLQNPVPSNNGKETPISSTNLMLALQAALWGYEGWYGCAFV
jgi:amino acid transporter